jgi:hypothetical protein
MEENGSDFNAFFRACRSAERVFLRQYEAAERELDKAFAVNPARRPAGASALRWTQKKAPVRGL